MVGRGGFLLSDGDILQLPRSIVLKFSYPMHKQERLGVIMTKEIQVSSVILFYSEIDMHANFRRFSTTCTVSHHVNWVLVLTDRCTWPTTRLVVSSLLARL